MFHAFANANQGVSRPCRPPGDAQPGHATLQKVQTFAQIVAPATRNLLPAVQAIPAANQATIDLAKPITPVLQTQIRPFVVAARPLVRSLSPPRAPAGATPNLSKVFTVLNHLFNELGYFPGGVAARLPVVAGVGRPQRPQRVLHPRTPTATSGRCSFRRSCASLAQIANLVPWPRSCSTSPRSCPAADYARRLRDAGLLEGLQGLPAGSRALRQARQAAARPR